ncbi:hypothetical protein NUW54_g11494 [Trametes sanguinea]|uniref:Uncharacterized protein n=1 Tax=Trametes sanguinea TaxID=158606 RepID=A0ACC1NC56_9APHY|nr:hypothetical protein NUW54_g11494 [Trametes sanguinea]
MRADRKRSSDQGMQQAAVERPMSPSTFLMVVATWDAHGREARSTRAGRDGELPMNRRPSLSIPPKLAPRLAPCSPVDLLLAFSLSLHHLTSTASARAEIETRARYL